MTRKPWCFKRILIKKEVIIFLLSFIIITLLTKNHGFENDYSRLAIVESVVERGTLVIDDTTMMPQVDKVMVNGHYYSDKPPILSLVASVPYYVLYKLGLSFANNHNLVYYLMTLICMGVPVSLMLVYFYRALKIGEKYRWVFTFGLFLCTLVLPYSLVFNNHIVAAVLLFIGFYFILKTKTKSNWQNYFISGFLVCLAATIDLVAGGVFLVVFSIYFLKDFRKAYPFFIAVLIPGSIHLMINYSITGNFIPMNLQQEYFDYPGGEHIKGGLSGYWNHESLSAFFVYSFNSLLGKEGFFLYNPVLLLGIFMIIGIIRSNHELRKEAFAVIAGSMLILIYYLIFSNNYGGVCYSIRWFVPFIPLIFYFNRFAITRYKTLFYVLLFISMIFSLFGAIDPWEELFTLVKIKKYQIEYYLKA